MKITLNIPMVKDLLEVAKNHHKIVRIQYNNPRKGEMTERFIEPTQFINTTDLSDLGILAFDHDKHNWRHFKLRNIQRLTITDYDFEMLEEE